MLCLLLLQCDALQLGYTYLFFFRHNNKVDVSAHSFTSRRRSSAGSVALNDKCTAKGLVVLRTSSACERGTRAVRGRRLCDRSGRICIGQGILAAPGCGELINLVKLVSGWTWLSLSSCQELVKDREPHDLIWVSLPIAQFS